jgi:hypothetical protein
VRRACRVAVLAASIFGDEVLESRFFTPHPRTYPKELTLFGAPETFGAPFVQNDTAGFRGIAGGWTARRRELRGVVLSHPLPKEGQGWGTQLTF